MTKVRKEQLVNAVAAQYGITTTKATKVVEAFTKSIRDALVEGRDIELRGFGSFRQRNYPNATLRNPKKGGTKTFKNFRRIVFNCSPKLVIYK